jgi:hypothetical protein
VCTRGASHATAAASSASAGIVLIIVLDMLTPVVNRP